MATASERKPKNLLEKIMCDADHDYLGRPDYFAITERLRKELAHFGRKMTDIEWIEFQLNYMVGTHRYYTDTAKNIRLQGKKARIADLKEQLNNLKTEQ